MHIPTNIPTHIFIVCLTLKRFNLSHVRIHITFWRWMTSHLILIICTAHWWEDEKENRHCSVMKSEKRRQTLFIDEKWKREDRLSSNFCEKEDRHCSVRDCEEVDRYS